MTRHAMLKSVRYAGLRSLIRNVHWLHALTAATIIVSFGPSSRSEAKSTEYETDMVEPLRASGSLTLNTDASEDRTTRSRNSQGEAKDLRGKNATRRAAPRPTTAHTKTLAVRGSAFII